MTDYIIAVKHYACGEKGEEVVRLAFSGCTLETALNDAVRATLNTDESWISLLRDKGHTRFAPSIIKRNGARSTSFGDILVVTILAPGKGWKRDTVVVRFQIEDGGFREIPT